MPGLSFDIFAKDKGASAAFDKIAKNADATKEAMARVTKASADASAASERLRKTQDAEADALGKVRVASAKLDQVRGNAKASTAQVTAAEEALAAAQRKAAAASDANAAAVKRAAKAQDESKSAAKQLADAQSSAFDKIADKAKSVAPKMEKAGGESGSKFSGGFSKKISSIGGQIGGALKGGLAVAGGAALAAGAVVAGGFISGFKSSLEQGSTQAKFQGQLGLSDADAAKAGKIAGDLYTANYGDSIGGVNDAIKSVVQNTNVSLNSVDLKPVTAKVLDLTSTFDQDLGGVTRATGQLMRTGLAKNATEALDIITKGFQSGADKSEDFLDTLNEYGTQFRKLGIDGKTATGLISQGLKAGARDGDLVADAIKEFSIRAIDGSATTADGFKKLGINAKTMSEQIAKGGKPAAAGLDAVLDRLRKVKDPVKQSQIAVELFGTQAEDLGKALFSLDPSTAVKALGDVGGAAGKLDQTLGKTPQAAISSFFRTLKQGSIESVGGMITAFTSGTTSASGFQGFLEKIAVGARKGFDALAGGVRAVMPWIRDSLLPVLEKLGGFVQNVLGPYLSKLAGGALAGLKSAFGSVSDAIERNRPQLEKLVGAIGTVVKWIYDKLGPVIAWIVENGFKVLGKAIGLVIDAIGWLVDNIPPFVKKVGELGKAIGDAAVTVYTFFKNLPATIGNAIGDAASWLVQKGKDILTGLLNGIVSVAVGIGKWFARNVVNPVVTVFSKTGSWLVSAGQRLLNGFLGGVAAIGKGIGTFFVRYVATPVVTAVSKSGQWLVQGGKNAIAGFTAGISAFISGIKGIGTWIYNKVIVPAVTPFVKAGSWLVEEGGHLIGGMLGGIVTAMKNIGTWIKSNIIDPVVGAVKKFFGINSPSKVFAEIGGHLIGGLFKGMGAGVGGAIAKKVFGDMPAALRAIVGKGLIAVKDLPKKALDALGGAVGAGDPIGGPRGNTSNEGIVRTLAAQYGWASGGQWDSLRALIMGESGFNNNAQNPTSSAYGIFQFLDSTWGSVGASKTSDPWAQTIAGLKYIAGSYGSPANAYAKWSARSPHWYGDGGLITETVLGVGLKSGKKYGFGERGTEVVTPMHKIPRAPGGGGSVTLTIDSGGSRMDDLLVELIRKYVKVNGGNVQAVLGRG